MLRRPRALKDPSEPERPGARRLSLTAVVPTLDDGPRLQRCLDALSSASRRGIDLEMLVVDGGSRDDTVAVAGAAGARVLTVDGSRGARFAAGGRAAVGEWLLLLRPETRLDRGWDATLMVFASEERNRERAGFFTFRIEEAEDGDGDRARRAEWRMRFRNRWLGAPSGIQGLVIRRRFLSRLGGVADLERGEDLLLARELGLGRMSLFDVAAWVHREDWRIGPLAVLSEGLRQSLFLARVPPRWLQILGD